MAEPAQGYSGPDDSSCYNCGARGHWAVACPEPTRKTPAGLANAWRNSPNPPQSNVQHSQRGPKRSNKGPIITKYAPPPPPPPLPHSSIGHGAPPYPPSTGPAYQQPSPQFQNSYPHHPPPIHYSAGYGPPTYPPPQYPPPSYGAAPAAPVGYPAHPPGPPAPTPAPYPPSYGSYPSVGPAGSPGYPPPTAYPPSYPQPSYGPPPVHYPSRGGPAHHPPPVATPPKPPRSSHTHSSLKEPINSSLPPKPPKSIHTPHEAQRDHRNKRKHDRQNNKHRDNRRKDQGRRRSHQKMQNKANHSGSATGSSQKAPALVNIESSRDDKSSSVSGLGKNAGFESEVSTTTAEKPSSNNKEESHQDDNQSYQSHVGELDEDSLVAGEDFEYHSGDESENTAQGLVTKIGAVSAGDNGRPSQNPQDSGYDNLSTPSSHHSDKPRLNGKHKRLDDESGDEQRPKKAKSLGSLTDGQNGTKEGSRKEAYDDARQAQGDNRPPEQEEDDQTLPPLESRSRSRSRERHQKLGSKSRNSSVSSRSSDLNSLEAELLGRPDKRSSTEPSPRQRRDSLTIPKVQRRRPTNADSAYSRRW
ncbi:hypothetical protein ACSS6W_007388 [Trichoderma asperelloides]